MSPLEAFMAGFHEGYRRAKRRTGQGGIYLRAYRRGLAARVREDNGGEDMTATATARR